METISTPSEVQTNQKQCSRYAKFNFKLIQMLCHWVRLHFDIFQESHGTDVETDVKPFDILMPKMTENS